MHIKISNNKDLNFALDDNKKATNNLKEQGLVENIVNKVVQKLQRVVKKVSKGCKNKPESFQILNRETNLSTLNNTK